MYNMVKPLRMFEVEGDAAREIGKAIAALSDVTERCAGCNVQGAIMFDKGMHMTLLIHPRIQNDPVRMHDFLTCLRATAELYEQEFVRKKIQ
jgi:hypothetical protein